MENSNSVGNAAATPSSWIRMLRCALGLVLLIVAVVLLTLAARHLNRWLQADNYRQAELEVTRFDPKPGEEGQGRLIEGMIQPGGEHVWTSDTEIAIRRFVSSSDTSGRRVPTRDETEGKRIDVLYWPQHDTQAR